MLFTMFVLFLFGWLFFHSIGLALHLTWCAAKVIAALLFAVALPVLLVCLFVAGGLLLLVPLGLIGVRRRTRPQRSKPPKGAKSPPSWTGSSLQRLKSRRNAALPKSTKERLSCEQKSEMAAGVVVLHRGQRTPEV